MKAKTLLSILAILIFAVSTNAYIDVYVSEDGPSISASVAAQASWASNFTTLGCEDFESFIPGSPATSFAVDYGGVTTGNVTNDVGQFSVQSLLRFGAKPVSGSNYLFRFPDSGAPFATETYTIDMPVAGFGFFFSDAIEAGIFMTITVHGVGGGSMSYTFNDNRNDGNMRFFGVTAEIAAEMIVQVNILNNDASDSFGTDDVCVGLFPEPPTTEPPTTQPPTTEPPTTQPPTTEPPTTEFPTTQPPTTLPPTTEPPTTEPPTTQPPTTEPPTTEPPTSLPPTTEGDDDTDDDGDDGDNNDDRDSDDGADNDDDGDSDDGDDEE